MTARRNRRKQTTSFDERLQSVAREARAAAHRLPPGQQREILLKKAGQAEMASRINAWLTSPILRSPTSAPSRARKGVAEPQYDHGVTRP